MMVMFIGSRSRDGDVYLEELGELIRVFPSFQKAFRRLHHQYQGCFGHPVCTRAPWCTTVSVEVGQANDKVELISIWHVRTCRWSA